MSDRFKYGMPAVEAVRQLNGLDDDVAAARGAATSAVVSAAASASLSASNAVSAAQARDAAIQAWQASTAPGERLAALSQTFYKGAVADVFLYDTSRDSDGGGWRRRCADRSWENEKLVPGKWLGQANGGTAAIAAGGVIGDYFQDTPSGDFYQIVSTMPANVALVYRGNVREFPALALIVLESGRMVIYDGSRPELPMWLVCANGGNVVRGTGYVCLSALNGKIYAGATSQALSIVDFPADTMDVADAGGYHRAPVDIAKRNNPVAYIKRPGTVGLVNSQVLDISLAAFSDAPIDPASGTPVPTAAIATVGGVSVIKHDGSIVHWMTTVGGIAGVSIDKAGRLCAVGGEGVAYKTWFKNSIPTISPDNSADGLYYAGSIPRRPGTDGSTGRVNLVAQTRFHKAFGSSSTNVPVALHLYKDNPAVPVKGMVAFVSNAYNSGWQLGDARGTWLADVVPGVSSGGELVVNGDFAGGTNSWTASGTLAASSGRLRVTNNVTGQAGFAEQFVSTVPGKTYAVKADFFPGTSACYLTVGASSPYILAVPQDLSQRTSYFVAVSTTTRILLRNNSSLIGEYAEFGNISVKPAEADRSVRANGIVINGNITKASVATGAQLVAYSGFSVNNYLEQPYNTDLDFGTGDFCVMAWVTIPAFLPRVIMERAASTVAVGDWTVAVDAAGQLGFTYQNVSYVASGLNIPLNTPSLIAYWRAGGKGYFTVNGAIVNIDTGAATSLTRPVSLRVGGNIGGTSFFNGSIALLRITATAPTPDQIAQIYRDERTIFQSDAQCTIDGASPTVTALAYDETSEQLHVGTSWGRSTFRGLQRVESAVTGVGAVTSLSAAHGAHITAGGGGARYYQPAMLLRDELRRKGEAWRVLNMAPVAFWRDGGAASYQVPVGFDLYAVYRQGLLSREGTGNDYTTSFDGYRWTVTFTVTPPANSNICIMGVRNGAN